jgi:hypothetical protein
MPSAPEWRNRPRLANLARLLAWALLFPLAVMRCVPALGYILPYELKRWLSKGDPRDRRKYELVAVSYANILSLHWAKALPQSILAVFKVCQVPEQFELAQRCVPLTYFELASLAPSTDGRSARKACETVDVEE